jgi:hypothetical protein
LELKFSREFLPTTFSDFSLSYIEKKYSHLAFSFINTFLFGLFVLVHSLPALLWNEIEMYRTTQGELIVTLLKDNLSDSTSYSKWAGNFALVCNFSYSTHFKVIFKSFSHKFNAMILFKIPLKSSLKITSQIIE